MKPLAVLALGLAILAAVPTASAQRGRIHLTFREAKREIRFRVKRLARKHHETHIDFEVGGCRRYSARRVRCRTYEDYKAGPNGDRFICSGPVEVIEFADHYRTRGKHIHCV